MSSIVELARFPEIQTVTIVDATNDEESIQLPGGLMRFVISARMDGNNREIRWAVEEGQVLTGGEYKTIHPGDTYESERMYVPNGAMLYLGAQTDGTIIEVVIYKKY